MLAVLMALPRFRRFKNDLPLTEDKGFEGASILMTVLGLIGLITTAAFLLFLLEMPGKVLTKGSGVLVALALAMLCVRSFLHVQAGFSGLRETNVDRSVELANRYANFGVISSFCFGGSLLLFVMTIQMSIGGLVFICGACWMLLAWPLVIRRWAERRHAEPATGEATESGPSTLVVNDHGTGIRFNFPGAGRFRPIAWDEWFRNFDDYGLVFVYEREVGKHSPAARYRMLPMDALQRMADVR